MSELLGFLVNFGVVSESDARLNVLMFSKNSWPSDWSQGLLRKACLLIVGLSPLASLQGQVVFSSPVGYVKLRASAATSATEPSNTFVNHALAQARMSTGEVTSGATDSITASDSTWSNDEFAGSNGPHFILMTDGEMEGQIYDIVSNSSNTLTLAAGSGDTAALVGDSFRIYQHNTLASVFGSDPEAKGVLGGLNSSSADQVILYDIETSSFRSYFFKNDAPLFSGEIDNDWVESGLVFDSAAETVIPPNQGFIYVRADETSALEVAVFGDVIDSAVSVSIAPGFNLIAVPLPVDTGVTLGTSGLNPAGGTAEDLSIHLQGGINSTEAETIFIFDSSISNYRSYFFKNDAPLFSGEIVDDWVESGELSTSAANVSLANGSFFIMRKAENPPLNWVFPSVLP